MIKNYFYLRRNCSELNDSLSEVKIRELYTQEKNKLFINISSEDFPNRHLVISTDQNLPFIIEREAHFKAKKNVVYFFNDLIGAEIISVEMAVGDRITKISTTEGILYFILRGNLTNIILERNNEFFSFKESKVDEELDYRALLNNLEYSNYHSFNFSDISSKEYFLSELRNKYPFISKQLLNEAEYLVEKKQISDFPTALNWVVSSILHAPVMVGYNRDLAKIILFPEGYNTYRYSPADSFDNFGDAVKKYISYYFRFKNLNENRTLIQKHLDKETSKVANRLNNLKDRVETGSREQDYYKYGNLLLMYKSQLFKGQKEATLNDYETGVNVVIKLDQKLSTQGNIDRYFDKARNEKISFEKSKELYSKTLTDYNYYKGLTLELEDSKNDPDKLEELKKTLKLEKSKAKMEQERDQLKLRHFLLDGKYHVYVGKDSQSNDRLSIKFAKQNDFWFHARGLPGSHTVLRVENTKEVVPKHILKNAASIAAYYSKAKTAKLAPVSYTFAKFVYKKKGFNPGQVALNKEQVLHVRPEIPSNAEIITE